MLLIDYLSCSAYINDDTFIQQALFLGSHDKVMSVVSVVHNVLQINTCGERARNVLKYICSPCFATP